MILYFHNKLTRDPKLVIAQNRRKIVMTGQPTPPQRNTPSETEVYKSLKGNQWFSHAQNLPKSTQQKNTRCLSSQNMKRHHTICSVYPPPRSQDASHKQRFSLGFPSLKMECHPVGDWNPGWWGLDPNHFLHLASP